MSSRAKLTLFFAIILFPLAFATATLEVGTQRTKRMEFCASCHVMTPFVADAKNPDSDFLASKHVSNKWIPHQQCYSCHIDYGWFGEVDAKVRSVRHAFAFYIQRKYERPTLYKPFRSKNCLHCHEGGTQFEIQPAHAEIKADLKAGTLSCLECHGPAHPGGKT
ncbi:MAG: hypothetical protein AUJ52_10890 [Elusimicrobia bacterium CG1_02_63_36]|nr:MAG: hypothetical protein AUJ52_10890 [Elusimicrobia bacterium CG1_02_63_36]PIP83387.1 MAG: hypothetical protein COR54_09660 [Elusimicrobia bacterium CG22_combo_CG10-13_8_21_14_all_63_91]PJA11651.1 MAG: hypothetical protein COX66_19300 [Elusimicrobia bacterium CG_4_10_14_0_2_um_filter_63_34]PJB23064.1 MAG: hypothetical protein CO113_19300 [Elusimicrobia bacterium CG_4_9_14_3_um_filter_62_55]